MIFKKNLSFILHCFDLVILFIETQTMRQFVPLQLAYVSIKWILQGPNNYEPMRDLKILLRSQLHLNLYL